MINPHPGLPEFDYIKPGSLDEASRFLAQHPAEARPLLGGTDCFVRMRDGFWNPKYLVDVKHLDGMDRIEFDPAQGLTIGAAVNMNRVIASPESKQALPAAGGSRSFGSQLSTAHPGHHRRQYLQCLTGRRYDRRLHRVGG
jgi:CO/xanthine dehydrogenase FAD-binding subunit